VRVTKTPMTPEDKFAEGVILDAQRAAVHGNTPLQGATEPHSRRPGLGLRDSYLAGRVAEMWRIVWWGR